MCVRVCVCQLDAGLGPGDRKPREQAFMDEPTLAVLLRKLVKDLTFDKAIFIKVVIEKFSIIDHYFLMEFFLL